MRALTSSIHNFAQRLGIPVGADLPAAAEEPDAACTLAPALREFGLPPGTTVANQTGWAAIERLVAGDQILTFDNGMQVIVENRVITIRRAEIPDTKAYTIHVPSGVLGNSAPMDLLPMQEVVLESDRAEAQFGDPFVLIPALLLDGYKGITRKALTTDLKLHVLTFESEQIIQTNGAMLVLAPCQAWFSPFTETAAPEQDCYPRLSHAQLSQALDRRSANRAALAMPRTAFAARRMEYAYAARDARAS